MEKSRKKEKKFTNDPLREIHRSKKIEFNEKGENDEQLIDHHDRVIDYLRVSVTDRCNLRCVYCIPEEGVQLTSHEQLLSLDEIYTICQVMASMGFHKIKLTGGEPLVRRNIETLVKKLKLISGIEQVTLTTNGVLLEAKIDDLVKAGIDAITISLDTLNPKLYQEITKRDELEQVLKGIEKVLTYPQINLKINCVPMGMEGQDLLSLASLAKENNIHVRYIEMMPIGLGKKFTMCSEQEVLELLEKTYGKAKLYQGNLGNGPCHYYSFAGFKGKIGFISAISHKFCSSCNRVRLTSQGFLKTCLQYDKGEDLKELMRTGCSVAELKEVIKKAIAAKPEGHQFLTTDIVEENHLGMSQIGG